jgi:hypothetical protein
MTRLLRRSLAFAPFVIGIAAFACTFPDVEFAQAGDGGHVESSVPGTDGEPPDVADGGDPTDAPSDAPGSQVEAAVPEEGGVVEPGKCIGLDPCDCDNDSFKSREAGCGGNDCNDLNTNVRPNQTYVAAKSEPPVNGDWNCDGKVEKQYDSNLGCSLGLGGREGFENDPPCGSESDLYRCTCLVGCSKEFLRKATQACR